MQAVALQTSPQKVQRFCLKRCCIESVKYSSRLYRLGEVLIDLVGETQRLAG